MNMGEAAKIISEILKKEICPLVLYHANCFDGFCAAWVANQKLQCAEFVPVQYGQDPPDVNGRQVYILDFSYKRNVLLGMAKVAKSLVVIDHHKTAQEELTDVHADNLTCIFDMNKSGGRLAWEYFFPKNKSNWLVDYMEDRDLWRWRLQSSKEINAFIASYEPSFKLWNDWSARAINLSAWDDFVLQGEAIVRYQDKLAKSLCDKATETEIDGYKILAVNTACLISEVGGKLAKGRPFGATWYSVDGEKQWSLRSTDDGVDVGQVAEKFGGGGHRNSAAFREKVKDGNS